MLKKHFVSEETEEAVKAIAKLLWKVNQDTSPLDLTMGLMLLVSQTNDFHGRRPEDPSTIRQLDSHSAEDVKLIETAADVMRHASAAYGWKLVCGFVCHAVESKKLIPVSTVSPAMAMDDDRSNVEAACKHTKCAKSDLVQAKWTSEPFNPGHIIMCDRNLHAVVVSVRGTWGVKDSITDLLASNKPFSFAGVTGFVHEGILRCAERKVEALDPLLTQLVDGAAEEEGIDDSQLVKRVIVTGHSLGGGTATLLALMLAERHPSWQVEGWAFAPAASMTKELAESPAVRAIIKSFLFREDVVPRLSYGSTDLLIKTVKQLLRQKTGYGERLYQFVNSGKILGERLTGLVEEKFGVKAGDLDVSKAISEAKKLPFDQNTFMYPAGHIFWLNPDSVQFKNSEFKAGKCSYIAEELTNPEWFGEILVTANTMMDHLPHRYEFALNGAAEVLSGNRRDVDAIISEVLPSTLPSFITGSSSSTSSSSSPVELAPIGSATSTALTSSALTTTSSSSSTSSTELSQLTPEDAPPPPRPPKPIVMRL